MARKAFRCFRLWRIRVFGGLPRKAFGCTTVWQSGGSGVRLFDAEQPTAKPGVPEHRTVCMGDGGLLVGLDRSEPARELATDADGSGAFANLQDEAIGRYRPTASLRIDAADYLCRCSVWDFSRKRDNERK